MKVNRQKLKYVSPWILAVTVSVASGWIRNGPLFVLMEGCCITLILALLLLRFRKCRISSDADGVTVVNFLGTKHFAWADIEDFTYRREKWYLQRPYVGVVLLHTGKRLKISSLFGSSFSTTKDAENRLRIDALRKELVQHRSSLVSQ
jgi:hypothetical protein